MCNCYIKHINFKVSGQGDITVINLLITNFSPWRQLITILRISFKGHLTWNSSCTYNVSNESMHG